MQIFFKKDECALWDAEIIFFKENVAEKNYFLLKFSSHFPSSLFSLTITQSVFE